VPAVKMSVALASKEIACLLGQFGDMCPHRSFPCWFIQRHSLHSQSRAKHAHKCLDVRKPLFARTALPSYKTPREWTHCAMKLAMHDGWPGWLRNVCPKRFTCHPCNSEVAAVCSDLRNTSELKIRDTIARASLTPSPNSSHCCCRHRRFCCWLQVAARNVWSM